MSATQESGTCNDQSYWLAFQRTSQHNQLIVSVPT